MSVKNVKKLLKNYGIQPSKKMGQNFLIDEKTFDKILEAADLSKNDIVLEIGPGIGNLTAKLSQKAKKVLAIEKDKKMCEILKKELKNQNIENVQIINEDILKINYDSIDRWFNDCDYELVANLPYYVASAVIRKFLEFKKSPESMTLMIQKEVAQRICAKPTKMSLLAVSVQFYARPKIVSYVSKKSFWPEPKVDSSIIKIIPLKTKSSKKFTEKFFKVVKAGFSHPRKQLINNLAKELKLEKEKTKEWLLKNKIQPSQRAESLSIECWKKLTKSYTIKQ